MEQEQKLQNTYIEKMKKEAISDIRYSQARIKQKKEDIKDKKIEIKDHQDKIIEAKELLNKLANL